MAKRRDTLRKAAIAAGIVVVVAAFLLYFPVTPCLNMYGAANPCIGPPTFRCADLSHNLTTGNVTMNVTESLGMNITDVYFGYYAYGSPTSPRYTAYLQSMENNVSYHISMPINPPGQCVPVDGNLYAKYTYDNQTEVQKVADMYIGAGMESVIGALFRPVYV